MSDVRVGIVGMGNAGQMHMNAVAAGQVPGAVVTAVACSAARAGELVGKVPAGVTIFTDYDELLRSKRCDAILVATPHPAHRDQTIAALQTGHHVLCEKPAGISAADARAMNAAADASGRVYSVNFNRRTAPAFAKLRELVRSGTLGNIQRASWTSTTYLRAQAYFDSSPWRGTWAGEGGGMLLNQLPHVLDLWFWTLGQPQRVLARCKFGRTHDIEVEDEVHAMAEYESGATVTLVGSTGEAPGSERVEIVGDRASAVLAGMELVVTHLNTPIRDFIRAAPNGFDRPAVTTETFTFTDGGDLITGITRDFIDRIRDGGELLAPGHDGVASLELANAMLLSTWENRWVELPLDDARYLSHLNAHQARSTPRRPGSAAVTDLRQSFTVK